MPDAIVNLAWINDLDWFSFFYHMLVLLLVIKGLPLLSCADPEIFMRGGPTKMVIFGDRRGGSNPPKIPKLPFFR